MSILYSRTLSRAALFHSRNALHAHRLNLSSSRGLASQPGRSPKNVKSGDAIPGSSGSKPSPNVSGPLQPTPTEEARPSSTLSLDFSPQEPPSASSQRTGAKSNKDSLSTIEKRRKMYTRFALGLLGLGIAFEIFYMGRDWDPYEAEGRPKDELEAGRWARTGIRLRETTDIFSKPQWKQLLPPQLPPPHGKKYTLLLSIDDLLITSVWDRKQGWRTAKRPGVDYFIGYLSQFYEVVIFTTQPSYTAFPIIDVLDRYHYYITYHLFREATRVVDNKIVKDLSYLNRDLSKVILIDTHPDHVYTHPENAILLDPWKGDLGDGGKGLVGLIPFLESIAFYEPNDVRPILKAYAGKNIPIEYAKREEEQKQKLLDEWRASGGDRRATSSLSFTGLFGSDPAKYTGPEPLTFLEQKRRLAQLAYKHEQAYIDQNKGEWEKARLDDIEKQKEMTGSLMGWMKAMANGGVVPPPEEQGKGQQQGPPTTQTVGSQSSGVPVPAASASAILAPIAGASGPVPSSPEKRK